MENHTGIKERMKAMNKEDFRIQCPFCNKEFTLDEAVSHKIREDIRTEVADEMKQREQDIDKKTKDLEQRREELKAHREALDREYEEKLTGVKKELAAAAKKKAQDEVGAEVTVLREELAEKSQKMKESQKRELDFAREKRQYQEKLEQFDLELEQRVSTERGKIKQDVEKAVGDSYKLKERELQMKIESMTDQIEELKRKGRARITAGPW
jgi:hypothetical protein